MKVTKVEVYYKGKLAHQKELADTAITIGRERIDNHPDIALDSAHKFMSKRHCTIVPGEDGSFTLHDGDLEQKRPSRQGIYVFRTRERINQPVVLKPGDRFVLGNPTKADKHYVLHIVGEGKELDDDTEDFEPYSPEDRDTEDFDEERPAAASFESHARRSHYQREEREVDDSTRDLTRRATLVVKTIAGPSRADAWDRGVSHNAAFSGSEFQFREVGDDEEVWIGRDDDCAIKLFHRQESQDNVYSRKHAKVSYRSGKFEVQCYGDNGLRCVKGSQLKGVYVHPHQKCTLNPGDRIVIGSTVLRFDYDRPPEPFQAHAAAVGYPLFRTAAIVVAVLAGLAAAYLGYRILSTRFPGQILSKNAWSVPTVPRAQRIPPPSLPAEFSFWPGVLSTPALGDLNHDGVLDVVVGGDDGIVYARDGNGGEIWTRARETDSSWPIYSSPILVDDEKTGLLNIFIGTRSEEAGTLSGCLFKFRGATGDPVQQTEPLGGGVTGIAAGDLNGDGRPEIVIGVDQGNAGGFVAACSHDNLAQLWRCPSSTYGGLAVGRVHSVPSIAGIPGGRTMVVFGADVAGTDEGKIFALQGDNGEVKWEATLGGRVNSSPALGDLTGDRFPDVVVSSLDGYLYVLDGQNGNTIDQVSMKPSLGTMPESYTRPFSSSPVLADVNGDGVDDILVAGPGKEPENFFYAFDGRNPHKEIWNFSTGTNYIISTPAIVDINRDGVPDVVIAAGRNRGETVPNTDDPVAGEGMIYFVSGKDRFLLGQLALYGKPLSSPVVADLTGDQKMDVVLGGSYPDQGMARGAVMAYSTNLYAPRGLALWPFFMNDAAHTGLYQKVYDRREKWVFGGLIAALAVFLSCLAAVLYSRAQQKKIGMAR